MPLPYSIREGLAGFRRAKFAAVASTSAMTVALVLIGLFGVVGFQAQQVTNWLRQRVGEVEIFLADNIEDATARTLTIRAEATRGVAETEFISKAQAEAIFKREFGEGADVFFDEPFLPASIRVRVEPSYANPDSLNRLVEEFSSWNRVDEVVFNQPLLVKVQENLRLITVAGLALGTLVIVAAIFLVGNTIRLSIYARRLLIRTMKLVGATDAFIRKPFVVEGILQGVLAGLLASLILWGLYRLVAAFGALLVLPDWLLIVAGIGMLVLGILLGWIASYAAVRRFVRKVALR